MRKILIFTVLCIITVSAWAVPARKGGIVVTQPDGSKITIHQHGDESFHWITNEKGEWLKQEADGFYQVIDSMSVKKAQSRRKASTIQPQQRIGKLNIAPRGLVILVNYQDVQFSTADKAEMDSMLNGENYSRDYSYTYLDFEYRIKSEGSARKYFYDASYGQYNPQFDVVGPVTVSKNMAYYGENDRYGDDKNAELMVAEACELVDDSVDFSVYDSDNDGEVDFVCVIYAGYGEANGGASNTIWPHQSYVSYKINLQLDGKKINDYVCCNEINYYSKQHEGIGTFCHEFSHILGLPDLYATNDAEHKTLGIWDIMASGSYNNYGNTPPTYSAYERFFMGWLTPRILVDSENVVLQDLQETNTALLISTTDEHNMNGVSPSPDTFYLIENRQTRGWDEHLPGHGMMLTKIQYNATKWNNNTVNNNASAMGVDLIEADRDNSIGCLVDGKPGDLFPGGAIEYLGIENHPIKNIKEKNGVITFSYKDAIPEPNEGEEIDENCRIYYSPATWVYIPEEIGTTTFGTAKLVDIDFVNNQGVLIFDRPVTSIPDTAFASYTISSVTIPNSVKNIGDKAFYHCTHLTSINIPDSVKSIGNDVFYDCSSLKSITLPYSITSIGERTFSNCSSLESITLPNSITSIGEQAFSNCSSLKSIILPNSVTSLGNSAFAGCDSLKTVTIGSNVSNCGKNVFGGCNALSTVFWNSKQCTDFEEEDPWGNSKIETLVFGDSVEYIPAGLCTSEYIRSLTIPNNVKSIGDWAFSYCRSLDTVMIGNGVTTIGRGAFYQCTSLDTVSIGNSVTSIGQSAFMDCKSLTSIDIPNSVTSLGNSAFSQCDSLKTVTIGSNVSNISGSVFSNCYSLSSVYWNAKRCADLTGNIWSTVAIENFVFGNSVECIPANLCYNQDSITSITVPANVTSIGTKAFVDCANLAKITCNAEIPPVLGDYVFERTYYLMLHVPCGTVSAYREANGWKAFRNILEPEITYSIEVLADKIFGTASVDKNTSCETQISATPATGYAFAQWSDGNTDNPRTLILTQDTVLTAEFIVKSYTISTKPSNPERGETAGDTTVNYSENVTISATPYYGYYFSKWNDSNKENPRTVQVTSDKTYTAYFEPNTYSITKQCNSEQGTIDGVSSAKYLNTVILTAKPNEGYYFSQWSDGVVDNPRTFVITQDTTFAAEFTTKLCTISTKSSDSERGETTGDTIVYSAEYITISAIPYYGYYFARWNDSNKDNPRTVKVISDKTYTAYFEKNTYSITKQCNSEHGTINGVSSAKYLNTVILTAKPNEGYYFSQWSDGVVDNPRTFIITQDTTFAAEFTINTYEVIINENEYGTTIGAGVYNYGDEVTLIATPHDGFSFSKWSNGVTDNPYIFIIMDNVTLSVEFDKISSVENTNIQSQQSNTRKLFRDGQLLILRDGKTYNVMGQEL